MKGHLKRPPFSLAGKVVYLSREETGAAPGGPGAPAPGLKLKMYDFAGKKESDLASGV